MASAAEGLGDAGDIDAALAAQADPVARAGDLAEEGRGLDALDAQSPVDQALAVLLGGSAGEHVGLGDMHPGDGALALEMGEGAAKQVHFGGGVGEIDLLGDGGGIGSGKDHFTGEGEGFGRGAGVAEDPVSVSRAV